MSNKKSATITETATVTPDCGWRFHSEPHGNMRLSPRRSRRFLIRFFSFFLFNGKNKLFFFFCNKKESIIESTFSSEAVVLFFGFRIKALKIFRKNHIFKNEIPQLLNRCDFFYVHEPVVYFEPLEFIFQRQE